MSGIQQDLKDGNKFEDFILNKIREQYPLAIRKEGYFPDYDIEIPEIEDTLECKFDRMSQKTGNLAIEFEYNKKPSGIDKSKAKRWVLGYFNQEKDAWMYGYIPSEALKEACKGKRVVNGGDRWASKMYLLPVSEFEKLETVEIFIASSV